MPGVGLVVDELLHERPARADVAHVDLGAPDEVAGREGYPALLLVEVGHLVVELDRLVDVVRLHARVALHEPGVGEQRVAGIVALGLDLHLAPLGGGGAEARHQVGRARAGAGGVHGGRGRLVGAVDGVAGLELEPLVDVARHSPVPFPFPAEGGSGGGERERGEDGRRSHAEALHQSRSLKALPFWSMRPRARRAHSVSGYSSTVRLRKM